MAFDLTQRAFENLREDEIHKGCDFDHKAFYAQMLRDCFPARGDDAEGAEILARLHRDD
ncbi:hypothetical protein [Methylobacter sp.]|uniref:hypothetical protein n=1 Tax=Methylobacter sp. TaxID=2051955 RepID=UPI0025E2D6C1|nr:hypothetical protein [Methylobacter sp.]